MHKFEILLSCMHLNDDIISRSKICSDTLIINQCDKNAAEEYDSEGSRIRIISTTDRGLTKSRNMAVDNSAADICLLCDDDETFCSGYEQHIQTAYEQLPQADVIIFDIENRRAPWGSKIKKLGYMDIMKVSSWQISFRRKSILNKNIRFDENMGAGTPNGAEEEFRFLTDCRKAGLLIYYYPAMIASVAQEHSTWRNGYDKTFFVNRGNTTRYIMGLFLSALYAVYYAFSKRSTICSEVGWLKAMKYTFEGIFENRFKKLKDKKNG